MPILNTQISAKQEDSDGRIITAPLGAGLQALGPRIQITLLPLEAQLKSLASKGKSIPPPVVGLALIDTGASSTCIDQKAAEDAGLAVVDSGPMSSATHDNEIVPIYAGRVDIVGMSISVSANRAYGVNLKSQELIALIGRDILASCVLVYNGPDGSFSLSI